MTAHGSESTAALGMYGLRLVGLESDAHRLLSAAQPHWPTLLVEQRSGVHPDRSVLLTADRLRMPLGDGISVALLDRDPLHVVIITPTPQDGQALIHPLLAFPSAAANRWLGRDAFHAGTVVIDGGAWVVAGDKEHGKTSLLAVLARHGLTILSDDIVVIENGQVYNGPACLDLREGASLQLGMGDWIGKVGARERWRHVLPVPEVSTTPLRGFIFLSWGDDIALDLIPPMQRLPMLFSNQAIWRDPPDAARFLSLAELPCLSLTRPRSWDVADDVAAALVERVGTPLS